MTELEASLENLTITPRAVNKGSGAGGANTNRSGKKFEEKTDNQSRLLDLEYAKIKISKRTYDYYLSKQFDNHSIVFVLQGGLKTYMKYKYNIDIFRCPDEAYIIEHKTGEKTIMILEKKAQNVNGSVETKLWAAPSLKREYEIVLGAEFKVNYGFCLSAFLGNKLKSKEKKYNILKMIFAENSIAVLFGDADDYFETLDKWLKSSL